ncbi:MAG: beta-galactosidase [Treponema sp.]|nr:beta-galactosidase [Treponema sp.]
MRTIPMSFPYGAVYFRKSNPPREDWERDYAQAAEDGINIFRHWFMWGAIETAPGFFDWDDYDRQLDLAVKYGIKTIIAEISHNIPEWLAVKYPELLPLNEAGFARYPAMGASTAVGGFGGGLCLDKPAAKELTANFLTKLAERYKGHPGLLGYDVQNECTFGGGGCYCADTIRAYQDWLKNKYGDLQNLKQAWKKYSYTAFEEIRYPAAMGFYQECADWLDFQHDNFYRNVQWKIGAIRKADADSLMTAHGVASTFRSRERAGCDDWEAAGLVEVYGFTWVPCRHGNEPWRLFSAVDITRAGSRGKTFWHAEAQGGHLWLQPQLKGRPANDGRIADEKDLRIWNLMSIAGGARGILYPRHRPLLDGPLFGAFAPYEMDGSRSPRSRMASTIAGWANDPAQKDLTASECARGQIGILYLPESSAASYLHSMAGNENVFFRMMAGAYQGFFDNNIQADFVSIGDIDPYAALYLPYPVAMSAAHAEKLKAWVKAGGVLLCEACPAYFGDRFHVGTVQPNYGLDEVFGVKQKRVEFMPDILTDIQFDIWGSRAGGEGFLQTYELSGGVSCAAYEGDPVAVSHTWGKGKTLLIGAFLSGRYGRVHDRGTAEFFKKAFAFTDQTPLVTLSDNALHARISIGKERDYLWLLNTTDESRNCCVKLARGWRAGKVFWAGGSVVSVNADSLELKADPRDALVIGLDGKPLQ